MPALIKYEALDVDCGKSVETILRRKFGVSTGLLRSLKLEKKIWLNNVPCRSVDVVKSGDIITADVSENFDVRERHIPYKMPLEILFEDEFLLIVNKIGGIETHPCPSNRKSTLLNGIMYYWEQKGEYHNCHIVNRLDKDTSGICIVAKNRFAHGVLSGQIKDGCFKKRYYAIVHGMPEKAEAVIEEPIARVKESVIKRQVDICGRYAKTIYKVIKHSENQNFTLLDIFLETGRTHQIRVHFSHIGHPLVGDWLYGNGDNERHLIKRQALHAYGVEFTHPVTKERLCFSAEMPDEMKKLINFE